MGTPNIQEPSEKQKAALPNKIVVAVHGIGDQFQFATIQSVANRFCIASKNPQALPLGIFYDSMIGERPDFTYMLPLALGEKSEEKIGFVEIYWADIPRIPEKEGYTLEESKKWGKTVIDRLRPHNRNDPKALTQNDMEMAKGLLEEMLETISVLERLLFIAEKAGVFKFNLKEILISYLGDVQLVADFKKYRNKILHRFFEVMNHVARHNPQADIYIVAHSEGTVVTFLSLLEAIKNRIPPDDDEKEDAHKRSLDCEWVNKVRGLMTIGSPIDKHIVLWPSLWTDFEGPGKVNRPPYKIQWRNYYDLGDPIGFKLDTARDWLCKYKYDEIFEFPYSNDHGFSRYPFPGKAHNDYWTDNEVFDHFITTVFNAKPVPKTDKTDMCPEEDSAAVADKRADARAKKARHSRKPGEPSPPGNKFWYRVLGTGLPYLLVAGLIFLGVYFFQKALNEYEGHDAETREIFLNVTGITILIIGLTVVAQIPRLTRVLKWRFGAFALFAVSCVGYWFITTEDARKRLGRFSYLFSAPTTEVDPNRATIAVIALAFIMAVVVYVVGTRLPRAGLRILIGLGVLALALTVGVTLFSKSGPKNNGGANQTEQTQAATSPEQPAAQKGQNDGKADGSEKQPLWPLFLAAAAFLYLWWLAALVFDLVIVWHYYIRSSVAMDRLRYLHAKSDIETHTMAAGD